MYQRETAEAGKAGATGIIFFNGTESLPEINSWLETNETAAAIPAVWVSKEISKILADEEANSFLIQLNVALKPVKRTGTNVIGYVDNKAARTVIIGAHYDHLGYGEDNNGVTKGKMLYHGANDNASGIAALLELARQVKASKLKNTNYLFVAFSGNEQSLSGSRYLASHPPINLSQANYMLNLDMIGRLNPSHGLQIAGMGTSPSWSKLLENADKETKVVYEASGVGNSDHTSFYRKQIPVLFFFTGLDDFHLPEDSADKINYEGTLTVMKLVFELMEKTDNLEKLAFTATPEPTTAAIK
nr:M20/M25/M40 family metallo-hydrolase [Chitinophaga sp. sic0106]